MILLQNIPKYLAWNTEDYLGGGALALLVSGSIFAIRWLIRENRNFKKKISDKDKITDKSIQKLYEEVFTLSKITSEIAVNIDIVKTTVEKYPNHEQIYASLSEVKKITQGLKESLISLSK